MSNGLASPAQAYRCYVLEAGPRAHGDISQVAVRLVGLDPMKAIGWRYADRMPVEVLATTLAAIRAGLEVSCVFANNDATGDIVAIDLMSRTVSTAQA